MGNVEGRGQIAHPISAVLADVDGTLVNKEKALTERAIQAVGLVYGSAGSFSRSAAAVHPEASGCWSSLSA